MLEKEGKKDVRLGEHMFNDGVKYCLMTYQQHEIEDKVPHELENFKAPLGRFTYDRSVN